MCIGYARIQVKKSMKTLVITLIDQKIAGYHIGEIW